MQSFIFIPIDKIDEANALAVLLAQGTTADAEAQRATFGTLLLSPTGQVPITHTACSINLSDELREKAREAVEAIGGVYFDGEFDFEGACNFLGLSLIQDQTEV